MMRGQTLARRATTFIQTLRPSTRHLQTTSIRLAGATAVKEDYIKHHSQVTKPSETYNFLDNQFKKSSTSRWIDLHDPATQNLVTRVPETTQEEMKTAVDSAEKAFKTWKNTSLLTRQQIMFRLASLIRENMDRLAASITLEQVRPINVRLIVQGKTFADAKGDVLRGLQVVEATTAIPSQMMGEQLEVSEDMDTSTIRVPLGVVAAICPFNFPAMIPLWVLPVAVATGNTLILKPSERDPGAAMIIAELAKQAGLPDGVFNIIHGTTKTVDFILDEPRIKAISFVGSDRAGKYIYTRGTANGKRVQANLGAKNHGIIMPDANKNHTLNALAGAAFGAAGQRCMALSTVVFVGETRDWLDDLVERAKALKVDGGFEEGADLGPLITPQSKQRVERLIQSGIDEGATLALDGRGVKPAKVSEWELYWTYCMISEKYVSR